MRGPLNVWWLAVVFQLGLACPGAAQDSIYILIDGPGGNIELRATGRDVSPVLNPTTRARGAISDPDRCPGLHYHGTLFDRPDPNPPGCGWGRVKPDDQVTQVVLLSIRANARMLQAVDKIDAGDFAGARVDLRAAEENLRELETFFTGIPEESRTLFGRQVVLARRTVEQVRERLTVELTPPPPKAR